MGSSYRPDEFSERGQSLTMAPFTPQPQSCCLHALQWYQAYVQEHASGQQSLVSSQAAVHHLQQELDRERHTSENTIQQYRELNECHCKLKKEFESLRQSTKTFQVRAEETAKRADKLVSYYQAKSAAGETSDLPHGQTIQGLVLEAANNAMLVAAMSKECSDKERIEQVQYLLSQNGAFQQENAELTQQLDWMQQSNEALAKEVVEKSDETASLQKALEMFKERKNPRRAKRENSTLVTKETSCN